MTTATNAKGASEKSERDVSSSTTIESQRTGRELFDHLKIVVPARHDKRFGLGIVNTVNKKVRVTTIIPNSIASEYFQVKDRVVTINGMCVTDKLQCRQLILSACSSAADFEIEIDRPKKDADIAADAQERQAVTEIPDLSSRALAKDVEEERGNPWDGFQYAPPDVRRILELRIKTIVNDFLPPYRKPTGQQATASPPGGATLNIDEKAQTVTIASDVPPEKQLMKPRK